MSCSYFTLLYFTLLYCLGEGLYFQEFYVQFGFDCSMQVKYHHPDVYPESIYANCHVVAILMVVTS